LSSARLWLLLFKRKELKILVACKLDLQHGEEEDIASEGAGEGFQDAGGEEGQKQGLQQKQLCLHYCAFSLMALVFCL
jgi:hypothetical protein